MHGTTITCDDRLLLNYHRTNENKKSKFLRSIETNMVINTYKRNLHYIVDHNYIYNVYFQIQLFLLFWIWKYFGDILGDEMTLKFKWYDLSFFLF